MMQRIGIVLVVFALAVWSGSAAIPADTNEVTSASILKDLGYGKVQTATLLTFISREDNRPWYVDDALLVLQLPKGEWMLVHAVRNPKFPKGHRGGSTRWHLHDVMDAPHVGDRRFDHRPARQEVDQFLKDNSWQFESDKFWRVARRLVDEEAWQKTLGYKPFIREKAQK